MAPLGVDQQPAEPADLGVVLGLLVIRVINWVISLRTTARSTSASSRMKTIRMPPSTQFCQCVSSQPAAAFVLFDTSVALVGIFKAGDSAVPVGPEAMRTGDLSDARPARSTGPALA